MGEFRTLSGAATLLVAVVAFGEAGGEEAPADAARAGGVVDETARAAFERFLARPDEPVHCYRARRRFTAEGLGRKASMEAVVELDAENGFRWQVVAEEGSGVLRNRGFRGMLKKEKEVHDARESALASLTAENYELRPEGLDDAGLVRLRASPRRKDHRLLDGVFVVTPDTADLVRAEGRLAKGPSFWTPKVEVVRHYARVQGHRVLVRLEHVAHVRLVGSIRMVVDYDYEMIEGETIGSAPADPALASAGTRAGATSVPDR